MKKFILFAVAATMFAACANENDLVESTPQAANETDANLISFDAYTNRSTTRAGVEGGTAATTALLNDGSSPHWNAGFGVFAYYTDNFDYTPLYVPNFMYNEKVTWQSGEFKYGLPKYWPNEHGSAAKSSDQDRVSFFAYLPWVNTDPSTGMLEGIDTSLPENQWGIMGMKRNSVQGDPVIQYVTSFDQQHSVDLCWGTTGSEAITWNTNSSFQTIASGKPWLNVRKPDGAAANAKVKFNFQHATAKLIVKVQTDNTDDWNEIENTETKTRVWIRSIRFTGIAKKAALNLNNPKANTARWIDYYGNNELEMGESVTVHDGRKDGSEGVAGAESVNETVLGINPNLIQKEGLIIANSWQTTQPIGVYNTPSYLFCKSTSAATDGIYVIPTGEKMDVEIVYDIETIDPKLPVYLSDGDTHGSSVENRILKQNVFAKLENGKTYTLNLKLGLKDVRFDAEISSDFVAGSEEDVYLPSNTPIYAVGTTTATITVPYTTGTFEGFTITGLAPGTATVAETGTLTGFTPTGTTTVPANGKLTISGTFAENTTVSNRSAAITVGQVAPLPASSTTITITQTAKPLVLSPISIANLATEITIDENTTDGGNAEGKWESDVVISIKKKANGSNVWYDLTQKLDDGDPSSGEFKYTGSGSNATVTLGTAAATGDKFIITIKVGDAPAVTTGEITVGS